LLSSSIAILAFAYALPFTPFGALFGFMEPPYEFFIALAIITGSYLILTEIVKKQFHKKYA
jgi:Mg2+-importing ATPase